MQILYIWASNAASILIIFSRHRKLLLVDLYIWRRFQTQTLMRVISPSVKKNPSLCDTSRKFGVCRNTPPVGYMTAAHLDHSLSWGVMLHAPSFTSVAWYFLRCLFNFSVNITIEGHLQERAKEWMKHNWLQCAQEELMLPPCEFSKNGKDRVPFAQHEHKDRMSHKFVSPNQMKQILCRRRRFTPSDQCEWSQDLAQSDQNKWSKHKGFSPNRINTNTSLRTRNSIAYSCWFSSRNHNMCMQSRDVGVCCSGSDTTRMVTII